MFTFKSALIVVSVSVVLCSISIRRAGWLDRVVEYQKKLFIDDLMKQSPVTIKARMEKPPPGYVDSKDWDYESVLRLLTLIRDSEGAAPVRQAFRRAVKTRRFMSLAESFKAFPSLIKDHPNDFHYDVDSGEYYADVFRDPRSSKLEPNDIIVVSNPVEAKLPSACISVHLLKSILENRAAAGRVMPTKHPEISWPVTPKRTATTKTEIDHKSNTTSASTAATEKVTTTEIPKTNDTSTASGNASAVNQTATNKTAA